MLSIERKSPSFEAQDPLEEVNLGISDKLRTAKVSRLLDQRDKNLSQSTKIVLLGTIMKCQDY